MSSATRITKSKKLKNEMTQLEESEVGPCLAAIPADSIPEAVNGSKASSLIPWLREPLAWFLLIGSCCFLLMEL